MIDFRALGYGEIGLDINPCDGCEDYEEPNGCKSNGGCAGKQTDGGSE